MKRKVIKVAVAMMLVVSLGFGLIPAYADTGSGSEADLNQTTTATDSGSSDASESDAGSVSGSTTVSFSDVPETYWGYETVQWAVENGIVSGFPDGTFRPDSTITTAEWAAMIYRAFADDDFPLKDMVLVSKVSWGEHFKDIPETHWADPYLRFCLRNGGMFVAQGSSKSNANNVLIRWQVIYQLSE